MSENRNFVVKTEKLRKSSPNKFEFDVDFSDEENGNEAKTVEEKKEETDEKALLTDKIILERENEVDVSQISPIENKSPQKKKNNLKVLFSKKKKELEEPKLKQEKKEDTNVEDGRNRFIKITIRIKKWIKIVRWISVFLMVITVLITIAFTVMYFFFFSGNHSIILKCVLTALNFLSLFYDIFLLFGVFSEWYFLIIAELIFLVLFNIFRASSTQFVFFGAIVVFELCKAISCASFLMLRIWEKMSIKRQEQRAIEIKEEDIVKAEEEQKRIEEENAKKWEIEEKRLHQDFLLRKKQEAEIEKQRLEYIKQQQSWVDTSGFSKVLTTDQPYGEGGVSLYQRPKKKEPIMNQFEMRNIDRPKPSGLIQRDFTNELKKLEGMGFKNTELNLETLIKYHGVVEDVINDYLS